MSVSKHQLDQKRDKARGSSSIAKKHLEGLVPQAPSSIVFDVDLLDSAALYKLLQACAYASALVSFGFNRSGKLNLSVYIEGERTTLTATDAATVDDAVARLTKAFLGYADEMGWLPTQTEVPGLANVVKRA